MLDEYLGLPPGHSRRFEEELRHTLFDGLPRDAVRLIIPPSNDPRDLESIGRFGRIVGDEPVQLQVLGIGRNGHIGFNEPGSPFTSRTRIVSLSDTTCEDMAQDVWSGVETPTIAVTQGLADIMAAKEILLLAIGNAKFEALRRAFREPQSVDCPASVLQTHPNLKVLVTPDLARAFR
jgi:glucosamine-6-phosphate deaminase